MSTDSWEKEQGQGLCVGRWGWQSRTAEPCTWSTMPSEMAWAGVVVVVVERLQMEKAAGRGVLEGERR